MALNFNKSNFKDESFLNVFFKNIVLRLIAVCLISVFVLTYIPDYMEKQYKEVVEKECAKIIKEVINSKRQRPLEAVTKKLDCLAVELNAVATDNGVLRFPFHETNFCPCKTEQYEK